MLIGGVAFTFLVASFGIGTAACESAAKFSANLAVKTATTLCAPVSYDGDTNHFFVPAIAFEAPASISSTVAIDALNRDQPRKALYDACVKKYADARKRPLRARSFRLTTRRGRP